MRSIGVAFVVATTALSASAGVTVDVYVYDFDFSINPPPGPVQDAVIYAGDTIRWVWSDDFHNTASCAGQAESWDSEVFAAGDTFVYQFTIPGVYQYYCAPHGQDLGDGTYEGMGGSITVLAVPSGGVMAASMALSASLALRRRRNLASFV